MTRKCRLVWVSILAGLAAAPAWAAGDAPTACDTAAIPVAALEKKVAPLLALEQVRQWMQRMPGGVHMTYIPGEAEVEQDGACYREVTLYEAHPDHLHLWHTFLIGERDTMIENIDGEWVPLEGAVW